MKQYSHAYDFAFEVSSADKYADDVTAKMLRDALLARVAAIPDAELLEACGLFDTFEIVETRPSGVRIARD